MRLTTGALSGGSGTGGGIVRSAIWLISRVISCRISCSASGMTVTIAAQLLGGAGKPSRSDVEKARRRLRKLTEAGLLHERAEGTGRGATSVWYLAEHAGNPRSGSHAESHAPLPGLEVTHPSTPVHANSETPGQKVTTEITDPHAHATGEKSRQGGVTYIPPGVTSPGGGWPGPKPPCRHPACWDALAGECLARRGLQSAVTAHLPAPHLRALS